MKAFALLGIILGFFTKGIGQEAPQGRPLGDLGVMRIKVRSADPYFIKAMLEGTAINQPELSTILGFAGIPDKESSLIAGIFGGQGRFIVDATDNSLIFIPKRN